MKVYVSELPKDCLDCPCYNGEYMKCKLIHCEHSVGYFNENELDYKNVPINQDFEELNCPLQPLTDYTKQVRNNAFDKINSEYAKRLSAFMGTKISVSTAIAKLDEVLDQIQGDRSY